MHLEEPHSHFNQYYHPRRKGSEPLRRLAFRAPLLLRNLIFFRLSVSQVDEGRDTATCNATRQLFCPNNRFPRIAHECGDHTATSSKAIAKASSFGLSSTVTRKNFHKSLIISHQNINNNETNGTFFSKYFLFSEKVFAIL